MRAPANRVVSPRRPPSRRLAPDPRDAVATEPVAAVAPVASAAVREPAPPMSAAPASAVDAAAIGGIADADAWHALVARSGLKGPARLLAEHAGFVAYGDGVLSLSLAPTDDHLRSAAMVKMVADALAPALGAPRRSSSSPPTSPPNRCATATSAPATSARPPPNSCSWPTRTCSG